MFEDILQSLKDPSSRHAMMVHFPIVLGTLSFLPILAALVFRLKHKALLWVALAMLVMMSVSVFVAIQAGEAADENINVFDMTPAESNAIEKHEELAENGWVWPLIPAVLVGIALVPGQKLGKVRGVSASLAVVGALGVAGWVGLTAHAGGQVVYVYGIGPPERGTKVPASEKGNTVMPSPFEQRGRDDE